MVLCRYFVFLFYDFFKIFFYRKVCASETCKGPCKIALEFHVSRWRAAELQIAQKKESAALSIFNDGQSDIVG